MAKRWLAAWALAATLIAVPAWPRPQELGLELVKARRWVEVELRYAEAIVALEELLRTPELSEEDRVDAYQLLAIAFVARGAKGRAVEAFARLLELRPAYQLDRRLSPKIHAAFGEARAQMLPEGAATATAAAVPRPLPPPPSLPRALEAEGVIRSPAPPAVTEPGAGPTAPGLLERWWFWALLGSGIVAGVTGAVLLGSGSPEPPSGTLDPIRLD